MEEPVIGRRRLKVLLVEDYPTVRNAIVKVLKSIHLEIVEAKNGIEALQILDNQSVDMVFTDLVMPEMGVRGLFLATYAATLPLFQYLSHK